MDLNSLIGRELAGFRLTARLGEGGMAVVFRGENTLDSSIVRAIKVVLPQLSAQPEFVKRVTLEARVLDRLQHPNVVRFYGLRSVPAGDTSLLAMELELLDGQPLSAMLRPGLPVAQVVDWVRQAAEGVSAAHALGVVHRDLKPDNLLLTRDGQIKVLDFGIARAVDDARRYSQVTMAGVIPGTPGYLAPEVCNGALPAPAADVYALGIVLYELLLGRHPLNEPGQAPLSGLQMMFAHVQRELPRLRSLRADVPETVEQALTRATAKDPAQRFADATSLVAGLRLALPMTVDRISISPTPDRFSSAPPVVTNFQLSPAGAVVASPGPVDPMAWAASLSPSQSPRSIDESTADRTGDGRPAQTNFRLPTIATGHGAGSEGAVQYTSTSQPPVPPLRGATNRAAHRSSRTPKFVFALLGGIVLAAAALATYVVKGPEIMRQPATRPPSPPEVVAQPQVPSPAQIEVPSPPAQLEVPPQPSIDFIGSQMQTRQTQFAVGMSPVLPLTRGTLVTGASQNYAVNMVPGQCYKIIGVGGPGVIDLDLKLYNPTNTMVDQDIATDSFPVIGLQRRLCPTAAGQYRLEVLMFSGRGDFGIQVFGR